jgi:hypothetical protein
VRLSEELARILRPPARRKRRGAGRAPREIVPSDAVTPRTGDPAGRSAPTAGSPARDARAALDAARDRLRSQIPPRGDGLD